MDLAAIVTGMPYTTRSQRNNSNNNNKHTVGAPEYSPIMWLLLMSLKGILSYTVVVLSITGGARYVDLSFLHSLNEIPLESHYSHT